MNRKLLVYDWKVIARDEDFRKYKKIYLLELDLGELQYQVGTELHFGNNNTARITKITVDLVDNTEYYEAVALNKWVI